MACKEESNFGRTAKVIKDNITIASGKITRVLRYILFSGCGIVKNPANPPSIIMETAKNKEKDKDNEIIVLDYDKLEKSNNVTSKEVEDITLLDVEKEESGLDYNDSVGICVSFKRRVLDSANEGPDTNVVHENWCTLYESGCTSFSRDTTDPKCLRNQEIKKQAAKCVEDILCEKENSHKRLKLVADLQNALEKADKALNN